MRTIQGTRGDAVTFDVTVTEQDGTTAIPLDGKTLWVTAKYRRSDTDTDAVFQLKSGTAAITWPSGGNVATVVVPASATASLGAPTALWYDVQLKDASGGPWTIEQGLIALDPEVTQAVA